MGNNGNGNQLICSLIDLESSFSAINFPALNNLLQMFSNNMNLNANKLPILIPSNASSNIPSSSHHGSNQSLNIPDQQQALNSPRTTNSNTTDSSLLICGPTAHSNPPFTPLYGNNAGSLTNSGAGREIQSENFELIHWI